MTTLGDHATRVEITGVEKASLRWAILAAWQEELNKRNVDVTTAAQMLREAEERIADGTASPDIDCDLTGVESILIARDADSPARGVDFWLRLLGAAMAQEPPLGELLRYPPVKFYYQNCGIRPRRSPSAHRSRHA